MLDKKLSKLARDFFDIKDSYASNCSSDSVWTMDGVGSKMNYHKLYSNPYWVLSVAGWDLVAMNVNDLVCSAGEPKYFMDYIKLPKNLDNKVIEEAYISIIDGMKNALDYSKVKLMGGETAIHGFEIDLCGVCSGPRITRFGKYVTYDKKMMDGNTLIGLKSKYLNSNGFTKAAEFIDDIYEYSKYRTPIYSNLAVKLIKENLINGCVHITGGGLRGNLDRVLGKDEYELNYRLMGEPFEELLKHMTKEEMEYEFNCGYGFVLITSQPKFVQKLIRQFYEFDSEVIGKVNQMVDTSLSNNISEIIFEDYRNNFYESEK